MQGKARPKIGAPAFRTAVACGEPCQRSFHTATVLQRVRPCSIRVPQPHDFSEILRSHISLSSHVRGPWVFPSTSQGDESRSRNLRLQQELPIPHDLRLIHPDV